MKTKIVRTRKALSNEEKLREFRGITKSLRQCTEFSAFLTRTWSAADFDYISEETITALKRRVSLIAYHLGFDLKSELPRFVERNGRKK